AGHRNGPDVRRRFRSRPPDHNPARGRLVERSSLCSFGWLSSGRCRRRIACDLFENGCKCRQVIALQSQKSGGGSAEFIKDFELRRSALLRENGQFCATISRARPPPSIPKTLQPIDNPSGIGCITAPLAR